MNTGLSQFALGLAVTGGAFMTWFDGGADGTRANRAEVMSLLVKCALAAGDSFTYTATNPVATYTWPGGFGLAANWKTTPLGRAQQERLSACLAAHLSTNGKQVQISLTEYAFLGTISPVLGATTASSPR